MKNNPSTLKLTDRAHFTPGIAAFLRGFTLIEFLSVIAVISVLTAVVTPSLLSSFRSSALTQAGNQIADLAILARQNALSRNAITAIVVVTSANDQALQDRSVAMLEMKADRVWRQVGAWIFLPEQTRVVMNNPSALPAGVSAPVLNPLRGTTLNASDYEAVIFYPDGRMESSATDTKRIRIAHPEDINKPSPSNYYDVLFNPENSSCRIIRP